MKTSGSMVGGRLRPEAQPALANYLVRFVDAFTAEGVPVFALTLQNEPGFEPGNYPGMKLDPQERASIIGRLPGPTLAQRPAPPLILDWDHNWDCARLTARGARRSGGVALRRRRRLALLQRRRQGTGPRA
jgi:glucosylceramidase